MRRLALLGVFCLLAVGAASAANGAVKRPLLGIAGKSDRFKTQTGQDSQVEHIFLGWEQGRQFVYLAPQFQGAVVRLLTYADIRVS